MLGSRLGVALARSVAAAMVLAACDDDGADEIRARAERIRAQAAASARRAREGAPAADAARPSGTDFGEDSGAGDPAPASGDLGADLAHFTTVDACVSERHLDDPVLGDAVLALGYDGFARDACRVLAAAKSGRASDCSAITVSSLSRHCEALVAILGKTPDACPRDPLGLGREPTCLALAARNRRLCAAVREDERARCEGILSGDDKRCAAAPRAARAACMRDVARLHGVVKDATSAAAPLASPAGVFKVEAKNGAPMRGSGEGSLALSLREGVLVTVVAGPAPSERVELGSLLGRGGEDRVPLYASAEPGVFAVIDAVPAAAGATPKAVVTRLDLVVPGGGTFSAPPTPSALTVTVKKLEAARGGTVELAIDGTVGDAERTYGVHVEAKTFVRDVVSVTPKVRPAGSGARLPLKPR